MLVVVSPAKNLDFESSLPAFINDNKSLKTSEPELIKHVKELGKVCKKLSPADLSSLMKISDKLAILNAERYSSLEFPFTDDNSRPSIYAFNGDVYAGLDAASFDKDDLSYAQDHFRILSGLYGLLKPLDLMQPYRLEMGTKLKVGDSENLYQYWDDTITKTLNKAIKAQGDNILINLASNEYFSSIKTDSLDASVVTPQFKDEKNGKYKVISFFAKKARGTMARFIIQNKVKDLAGLKKFSEDGYKYDASESTSSELVFKRKQA